MKEEIKRAQRILLRSARATMISEFCIFSLKSACKISQLVSIVDIGSIFGPREGYIQGTSKSCLTRTPCHIGR